MTTSEQSNKLYFGDNLDILRQHVANESVDLIYLDPPFNSNATYNVPLPREERRAVRRGRSQPSTTLGTGAWNRESAYHDVVMDGPKPLADLLQAMRSFLGQNDMMAYLTMMAQRLYELHRVLKQTGSIIFALRPYCKPLLETRDGRYIWSEILQERKSYGNEPQGTATLRDSDVSMM